jgi:cobalamin biosynthesis protein CbiD
MRPSEYPPRSLLYVPGSNARALEKAAGLAAEMLIIDLEDVVPADRKADARAGMSAAILAGFPGKRVAIRINGTGCDEQTADIEALVGLTLDAVALPEVHQCRVDNNASGDDPVSRSTPCQPSRSRQRSKYPCLISSAPESGWAP